MKRIRILIIDDDPCILEALAEALEDRYSVCTAPDGKAGLAELERHRPDVVLLDLMMPIMDGITFLEFVRLRDASLPVLVVSASHQIPPRCGELGIQGCLSKPFDLDTLDEMLERVLGAGAARPAQA